MTAIQSVINIIIPVFKDEKIEKQRCPVFKAYRWWGVQPESKPKLSESKTHLVLCNSVSYVFYIMNMFKETTFWTSCKKFVEKAFKTANVEVLKNKILLRKLMK